MEHSYATIKRIERFLTHVTNNIGCWEWSGYLDRDGYGRFGQKAAHRFAYLLTGNKLVDGMDIDHLCRNRKCVNPKHLEQVTRRENIRRGDTGIHKRTKTVCIRGHAFDDENTYFYTTRIGKTARQCRKCSSDANRRRYLNKKIILIQKG